MLAAVLVVYADGLVRPERVPSHDHVRTHGLV